MAETKRPLPTPTELFNDAQALDIEGKWSNAIDVLGYLLAIPDLTPIFHASVLCERGLSYRMIQEPSRMYKQAEIDFKGARQLAQKNNDWQNEAIAQVGLIDLLRTGDRDPKYGKDLTIADSYKQNLQVLLTSHSDEKCIASVKGYQQCGLMAVEYSRWSEAESFYVQSLEDIATILQTNPDDPQILNLKARSLLLLSQPYDEQGQDNKALDCLNQALDIYEKLGDVRGVGNAAMSFGEQYRQKGNLDTAKLFYKRALGVSLDKDREIYQSAQAALSGLERT